MCELNNDIQSVSDNNEKYFSYKVNLKRFKKAKEYGYYFECLWILYAMIEDRTSSFLYHIGFTSNQNRNKVTGTKKVKKEVRNILGIENSKSQYRFRNISGKLDRIKFLIKWSVSEHNDLSPFQQELLKALSSIKNIDEINNALKYLDLEWREKRNQLTHVLFNKKPNAVQDELVPLVENGINAVRIIDNYIKRIKRFNIRKKFHVQ